MSNYVKIWTDIFNDEWFVSLNNNQRGVWLQLIVLAKRNGDTGELVARSWQSLGEQLATARRTLGDILYKFEHDSAIKLEQIKPYGVRITITNYHKHQRVRTVRDVQKGGKCHSDFRQANKIREEKIKEDKIRDKEEENVDKSTKGKEPDSETRVDRFDKWVNSHKDFIKDKTILLRSYWGERSEKWVRQEIKNMRSWIMDEPVKGNKKNWQRFVGRWLKNANDGLYNVPMTASQEQEHYRSKERTSSDKDFTPISKLIEKELNKE